MADAKGHHDQDLRSHPQQDLEHEGANDSERVIEACRRDNTELLAELIEKYTSAEEVAKLLNEARTVLGNFAYHEAALRGNYDVIDMLLDQEGFECDPINKRDGDTPLHCAVRWVNELPETQKEEGVALIDMMIEAGSDARIRNKAKLKAFDLADPRNTELREKLSAAEYMIQNQGDFIDAEVEDEGPTGSASDSDYDEPPPPPPKK